MPETPIEEVLGAMEDLKREIKRWFDGAIWALTINNSDTSELEKARNRQLAKIRPPLQEPLSMTLPAVVATEPVPLSRDIIKELAMDVGKEVAHHIERMYPAAVAATSSTFLLSVRNCTFNAIMAATEVSDEDAIRERLAKNKAHRREVNRLWKLGEKAEAWRKANGT